MSSAEACSPALAASRYTHYMSSVLGLIRARATPLRLLQAIVVACALLAIVLVGIARAVAGSPSASMTLIGRTAPALSLPAEQRGVVQQEAVTLDEQRGHITLVVFFFSVCSTCLDELHTVRDVAQAHAASGARVLYVDSPGENAGIVDLYAQRIGIRSPVLLDANAHAGDRFHVTLYPTIVVVDRGGVVRNVFVGTPSAQSLDAALRTLR